MISVQYQDIETPFVLVSSEWYGLVAPKRQPPCFTIRGIGEHTGEEALGRCAGAVAVAVAVTELIASGARRVRNLPIWSAELG